MILPRSISRIATCIALQVLCIAGVVNAQHGDKPRPEAWNKLVHGGRFMDRILPAPVYKGLERDAWGADAVKPRDIHNGIEDPMVWRTDVQYHTIVNDWYGRTAYHLRSRDGVYWTMDPGEAYTVDFDGYEDGTKVRWYNPVCNEDRIALRGKIVGRNDRSSSRVRIKAAQFITHPAGRPFAARRAKMGRAMRAHEKAISSP